MRWHKLFSFWEFLIFFLSLSLFLFFVYFYFYGISSSFTNKGLKLLKEKKFTQAQQNFHIALAKHNLSPWPYLNVALGYDLLKTPNKALKTYDIVSSHLKKKSRTALFYAYFNKGELYGRLGQPEEALQNYQQALEFEYKEKEIKTNIELLIQKDQKSKQGKESSEKNQEEKSKEGGKSDENPEEKEGGKSGENPEEKEEGKSNENPEEKEGGKSNENPEEKEGGKSGENPEEKEGGESNENPEEKEGGKSGENPEEEPSSDANQEEGRGQFEKEPSEQDQAPQGGGRALQLNNKQEEAIFEEVEKQENNARSKIYQRKNIFGDKAKKDW